MKIRKFFALGVAATLLCSFLGAKEHKIEPQKAKFHHKLHMSKSSSDHVDKKIDRLNHNAGKCCKRIVHELHELDKKAGCDEVHVICHVPAVIDLPGKWCVKKDLVYTGSGAAITIMADNVTLNFHNHSLTLTNPSAVGVYAEDVQEITIENDIIQSTTVSTDPSSCAFQFVTCEKVKLDNIFTANTFFGVHAEGTSDLLVTHSRFKDHIGGGDTIDLFSGGIRADTCSAVVVEESTFSGAGAGFGEGNTSVQIIFRDGSTACRVSNCEFSDIEGAVLGYGVAGLVIEGCQTQTVAGPLLDPEVTTMFTPVIQLGSSVDGFGIQATDVTVRNCLLNGDFVIVTEEQGAGAAQFPIFIGQASMILVDNCEIGNFITYFPDGSVGALVTAGVFLEDKVRPHGITIRGCMLKGETGYAGILLERADDVVVENCVISGTQIGMNLNFLTNLTIRDSVLEDTATCAIFIFTDIDGLTIANNSFIRSGATSILLVEKGDSVIKNVVVEGNSIVDGHGYGISLDNTENVVIKNNVIDGVAVSGIDLIPRTEGHTIINTTIQGNIISNSGFTGIEIVSASNTLVQDNVCNNNGQDETLGLWNGILVLDSSKTDLIGNSVAGNRLVGIGIGDGSTDTIVRNNTVSTSGANGIELGFVSNTTVQDNISNYNGQDENLGIFDGIIVFGSSKTDLIGNSCIGNTEAGIAIGGGSTDTFMQNNTTTHNGVWGINDDDNAGELTAFFNKSCDNGVTNCVNVPLAQAPGDNTYIAAANVCCSDPDVATATGKAMGQDYKSPTHTIPEIELSYPPMAF